MAGSDELVTILGIELSAGAMANLKRFQSGIESVAAKLKTFSMVATGVAAAAGLIINNAVNEAAALQTLSDKTGVSTDALQEWGYAAGQVGADAKAVQGDLVALTKSMSSPIPGQFNVNLAMIGVTVRDTSGKLKDSGDILEDLGGKMQGMSAQKAAQWGQKIGISDDTVLLLRQGKEGIAKLRKEAQELGAIIPSEAIKRAAEFKTQITSFQAVLKSLTSQIAIGAVPALSRVIDLFKGWVTANRSWIALHTESFMTGLVSAFERVWGAVKKVIAVFQPLTDKLSGLTDGMDTTELYTNLITGALVALAVAFSPVIFAIAKAAALFLALSIVAEDVFGYLNGEDSVTGAILDVLAEKFPGVTKLFGVLKDLAVSLFEGAIEPGMAIISKLGQVCSDIFTAVGGYIDYVAERWANFFGTFAEKYPAIINIVKALGDIIGAILGGSIDLLVSAIQGLFTIATKVFGWLFDALEMGMSGLNKLAEWAGFGGDEEKTKETVTKPIDNMAQRGYGYSGTQYQSGFSGRTAPESSATAATPARAPAQDMTRYAPAPQTGAAVLNNPAVQSAMQAGTPMAKVPPVGGNNGPVITDNRTVVQHINTSDPVQAGNVAAQRAGGSYTQLTNPGLNSPVVR